MNRKLFVCACVALAAAPLFALAQTSPFRDAGSKIRGDAYWPGQATTRYIDSARNYAQDVQNYVAKSPQPEPSVVKEIHTELNRYLDAAKTHLASMKKDFAGDKETITAVEGLEKELTSAIEHHNTMIVCCQNEKFDKVAAMGCCSDLVKSLDKIHGEHVALMKKLGTKHGTAATTK